MRRRAGNNAAAHSDARPGSNSRSGWRRSRITVHVRRRPRLVLASLAGLVVGGALWPHLPRPTAVLVAWNLTAGLYVALAFVMMLRAPLEHIRRRAREQDDGAVAVLTLTLVAAVASLAAIALELRGMDDYPAREQFGHLALAGVTIVCSWFLAHTTFALHYAHSYYTSRLEDGTSALEFPRTAEPDYMDFLYFSFVIGTSAQTADVSVTSSPMRRLVALHCIVTFFFNTTLLALTINIAAGML